MVPACPQGDWLRRHVNRVFVFAAISTLCRSLLSWATFPRLNHGRPQLKRYHSGRECKDRLVSISMSKRSIFFRSKWYARSSKAVPFSVADKTIGYNAAGEEVPFCLHTVPIENIKPLGEKERKKNTIRITSSPTEPLEKNVENDISGTRKRPRSTHEEQKVRDEQHHSYKPPECALISSSAKQEHTMREKKKLQGTKQFAAYQII